jgi:hypothetical protein
MREKLRSFPVMGFGCLGRRLRFVPLALTSFRVGETLLENTHQVDDGCGVKGQPNPEKFEQRMHLRR